MKLNNKTFKHILKRVTNRIYETYDLNLLTPRSVIESSYSDLNDEWHNAHVLSVDDIQLAAHGLYDTIVDYYYLEDEFTEEQLKQVYNRIFDKLDAEHKNYVDYDE